MHYLPPEVGAQYNAIQHFIGRGYAAHYGPVALAILEAVKFRSTDRTGPTVEEISKLIGVTPKSIEVMLKRLHEVSILQTVDVRVRPKPNALAVSGKKLKLVIDTKAWELIDNLLTEAAA